VPDQYVLRLFVAGSTARARQALDNLQRICDHELQGRYRVEVVDVLERPDLAEEDRILATPTLIKRLPPPLRRVIGDLSDTEKVLLGLELRTPPRASRDRDETT
jgi:circadian clock protein KaiB